MLLLPLGLFCAAPVLLTLDLAAPTAAETSAAGVATSELEAALASPALHEPQLLQAFWLEQQEHAPHAALALYEAVAADRSADRSVRAAAEKRASILMQDFAGEDLAQVLPPEALMYMELSQPGDNLAGLLEQLGLYGHALESGEFGISPDLVQGLLGAKGAALAVTSFPSGGGLPSGVLVVHPGDLELTRGLMETVLPTQGRPVEAIEDYPTWAVPVQGGFELRITMTERMFIVSNDPYEIGAVVERMHGLDDDNLAGDEQLADALAGRHDALLSVCFNARPLMPMVRSLLAEQVRHDPQAAMLLGLADLDSFQSLSAHVTAGEAGLGLTAALQLQDGHRNLVFDALRFPNVGSETLALVPEGAAFAVAAALNPAAAIAPLHEDAHGRSVVSLLDVGRELFSNVVDVALFGVPSFEGAGGPPDVALVVRANDPERTQSLLELGLGLASNAITVQGGQAGGGRVQTVSDSVVHETIAGVEVARFDLQGMPLYLASEAGRVVLSPSPAAIARTIDAASGHGSLLSDSQYAAEVGAIQGSDMLVAMAAPGRLAEFAGSFLPSGQQQQLAPLADLMQTAVFSMGLVQDDTHLGLHAHLRSLPDVSDLVVRALRGQQPWGAPAAIAGQSNGWPAELAAFGAGQ